MGACAAGRKFRKKIGRTGSLTIQSNEVFENTTDDFDNLSEYWGFNVTHGCLKRRV